MAGSEGRGLCVELHNSRAIHAQSLLRCADPLIPELDTPLAAPATGTATYRSDPLRRGRHNLQMHIPQLHVTHRARRPHQKVPG